MKNNIQNKFVINDEYYQKLTREREELENKLIDINNLSYDDRKNLLKEHSSLSNLHDKVHEFLEVKEEQELYNDILTDDTQEDHTSTKEELKLCELTLKKLQEEIELLLIPKEKDDESDVMLEIRAGTGGGEAALFVVNLLNMYKCYAENQGWTYELISSTTTDIGGMKEVVIFIKGKEVYGHLKYESGVHRVQRVPETESQGRVHTSAATVAVLLDAEDTEIEIRESDLRIDYYRSSGPGGQSVNTTDSAVRIVHIPTGVMVQQQDEKSQHKNKAKALKILKARVLDQEKRKSESETAAVRKEQVGTGDRSERIRTYNFPQNRLTDHRINKTMYGLLVVVNEGKLDEMINSLRMFYHNSMLQEKN